MPFSLQMADYRQICKMDDDDSSASSACSSRQTWSDSSYSYAAASGVCSRSEPPFTPPLGVSSTPGLFPVDEATAAAAGKPAKAAKMHSGSSATKDRTCLVCGDRALGYNFNAVSCESCKAFFRRNAFKEIRGRCEGRCEVTVESRSYCKRCRLQKCFKVGMKRELILNDQQKQQRCRKIQANRIKRTGVTSSFEGFGIDTSSNVSGSSMSPSSCPSSSGIGAADYDAPDPPKPDVTHIIASIVDPNSLEGLNEFCTDRLKEVMHAFKVSFDHSMEHQPIAAPSNTEFLNMADTSVRRLVKMSKNLAHFRRLEQEDQISLLKGAVVEVLVLRSSKMFNSETMAWQVSKEGRSHQVSAMSLNLGSPDSMLFIQQYRLFVGSLLRSTRQDNIALMLLIVMTVFSPDRARPASVPLVSRIQEEYANVLHEYVSVRYAREPMMLARLLQRLTDIRDLNEKHTSMLMNMKVDELEPLIVEIFDLSSC